MRQSQVFISYRRDDAAGYARALYDELARHLGADRVFIDVDDIHAGQPFGQVIEQALDASQVLLVLIGRRWLGPREGAPPRITEPGDFVRREVAAGLARGARVIPLLLDGARMPAEADLPPELHALAGRQALELDNARYATDVARLLDALRQALGPALAAPPAPPAPPARRRQAIGAGLAAAALLGALALALRRPRPAAPRAAVNGQWQARVSYDWPGAHHTERFVFGGTAGQLHGSAGFLGVPRGVLEGRVDAEGLRFVTRTAEVSGGTTTETVHRYQGRLVGDELHLVMQTEGGSSPHAPVTFVARRVGD